MSDVDLLTAEQMIAAYVLNADARRELRKLVRAKDATIFELRESVSYYGEMADACVYDTLKTVCTYCRCSRGGHK